MKQRITIASVWFDRHDKIDRYKKYSKVWNHSARKVFKNINIICKSVPHPDYTSSCPVFYRGERKIGPSKTLSWLKKIDEWDSLMQELPHKPVLFCDIDIAFFGNPFPELSDYNFDVGICGHNTGAVYFSGSQKSRKFMTRWWLATHHLFNNPEIYVEYDKKYKGLDQASLGYLLETGEHDADVIQLPRRFHSVWNNYEDPCYVMHYHSALRSAVFNDKDISILPDGVKKYFYAWHKFYNEAINE